MKLEKLQSMTIARGSHTTFEGGACALEMVAWIADEPHSDHPKCACPAISAFVRTWNDSLPDADRTRILLPLIPLLVGTRNTDTVVVQRAYMAIDWDIRVRTPAWLRLAGMTAHAYTLASLPEIVNIEGLREAEAACSAADSAAWSAARSAADSAAWSAAWSAARSAADSAAWSAARSDLTGVVTELQESASNLVRRMCEVT